MADRVVVLSPRPGTVRAVHDISFGGNSDLPPLKRRNHPAFREYFNLIWKELDANV